MKALANNLAARLERLPPAAILTLGLLYTIAVGAADFLTSDRLSFGLLYFIGVALVAWGAGLRWAWPVAAVSVGFMGFFEWSLHGFKPHPGFIIWNTVTRLALLGGIAWLVAEATRLTRRLGALVEERTSQWKAEAEQHKATSERLAEAVQRFEQVVNNITEVFWLSDVSKREHVYISPGYERIWGRPPADVYRETNSWLENVHPDDREEIDRRSHSEQPAGGYDVEYRIVRPDGGMRWIRDRAFPVRNDKGEVYRIAGIAEDITDRKRAEEALKTQAAILENMAEGVVVTDEQGLVVQMNPAGERIWGYRRDEVLGQPASVFSALPEPKATEIMRGVLAALQTDGIWRGTFENRRKDGAVIFCDALINRLAINGRTFLVAVEQDVTERIQAEEQLRMQARVLDSMAEAVLVVGQNGVITLANPAVEAMTGYTRDELLGQPLHLLSVLSPDQVEQELTTVVQQIKTGGFAKGEYTVSRKDGSPMTVATRASGLTVGDRFFLVIVGQDISERIRAEEALREAHAQLERRVQERTAELQAANAALSASESRLRLALEASKRIEQELATSEALLRAAFDHAPLDLWVRDLNQVCILENAQATARWGSLVGTRPEESAVSPEVLAIWQSNNRRALAGEVVSGETEVSENGQRRWIYNVIAPFSVEGEVRGIVGLNLDITERKQAEAALRKTSAVLQAINQGTDNLICVKDRQGKIIMANPAMCRFLGKPESELIGTDDLEALPDPQQVVLIREHDRRIMETGRSETVEETVDGPERRLHCLFTKSPYRGPDGEVIGLIGIGVDITERKQAEQALREARDNLERRVQERTAELQAANTALRESEERYRSLVNNLNVGVYRNTPAPEGRLLQINPALARMHGYDSVEEFIKIKVVDTYQNPADRAQYLADLMRQGTLLNYELRLKKRDGTPIYASVNAAVHRDENGEVDWIDGMLEDITERKKAEEALRQREELNRTILATAMDGFYTLDFAADPRGAITEVNDAYCRMIGYTREELLRLRIADLEAKETPEEVMAHRERLTAIGSDRFETRQRHKNGQEIHLEISLSSLPGRGLRVFGFVRDISERKHAEAALRASEERYRSLFENSATSIWEEDFSAIKARFDDLRARGVTDFNTHFIQHPEDLRQCASLIKVLAVNPESLKYWDVTTPEELIRQLPRLFVEGSWDVFRDELVALAEGRTWFEGEGPAQTVNGVPKHLLIKLSVVPGCAEMLSRVMVSFVDVSQAKRAEQALRTSEERYRTLAESSPDAIFIIDRDLVVQYMNSPGAALWCRTPGQLVGRPQSELFPAEMARRHTKVLQHILQTGESFRRDEFIPYPAGDLWQEVRLLPLRDEFGHVIAIMGAVRDITARKEAEESLRTQGRQLAEAMDLARLAHWEYDLATARFTFDDRFFALYGTTVEREGGSQMSAETYEKEFLLPDDAGLVSRSIERTLAATDPDSTFQAEHRIRRRDGEIRHIAVRVVTERDAAGRTVKTRGVNQDITERRRAESLLQTQRDVAASLSVTSDIKVALGSLIKILMRMDGVDAGGAHLTDPATGDLHLAAHFGRFSPEFLKRITCYPAESPQARLINLGQPIYSRYEALAEWRDPVRDREGLRALAILPLCYEGAVVGSLNLVSHTIDSVPEQTRMMMETVATQAAGAIARIRAEAAQHSLEQQLLEISDREQARMGQDIHDGLCQQLVALAFDANGLQRRLSARKRPEAAVAGRIAGQLDQAITETRQVARGLFPTRLEAGGLSSALEELAKTTRERFRVGCVFEGDKQLKVSNAAAATHLYRIAREAVNNAVKHARPRHISIVLHAGPQNLELKVVDDGAGIARQAKKRATGMGLHIMDYRARSIGGTLLIRGGARGGTTVSCAVPWPPAPGSSS